MATKTYTLTASNGIDANVQAWVPITVTGTTPTAVPVINYFRATPPSVAPGQTFMLSWSVTGATNSIYLDSQLVGSSGSQPMPALSKTTTYYLEANNGVDAPVKAEVVVTLGGAAGSNQQGCCITKIGAGKDAKYDYQEPVMRSACASNLFQPLSCVNLQSQICTEYCGSLDTPLNGACSTGFANEAQQVYGGICAPGYVCKCSGVNQDKLKCEQACSTSTPTYGMYGAYGMTGTTGTAGFQIQTGMCASNIQYVYAASGMGTAAGVSGSTYNSQPRQLGAPGLHGCTAPDACFCYTMSMGSFTQNTATAATVTPPPTLPGTECTARWCPDGVITDKPVKAANERACDIATNASITASFATSAQGTSGTETAGSTPAAPQVQITSTKLVQSGSQMSISGKVGKLADKCNGYIYTCRQQKEVECTTDDNFLYSNMEYADCPAEYPDIVHEQGAGRVWHYGRITKLAGAAAMIGAGMYTSNPQLVQAGGALAMSATQPCPGEKLSPAIAMAGVAAMLGTSLVANDMTKDAAAAKAAAAKAAAGGAGAATPATPASGSQGASATAAEQTEDYLNNPAAKATANPTFDITGRATGDTSSATSMYSMMMMQQMLAASGGSTTSCFNSSNLAMTGLSAGLMGGMSTMGTGGNPISAATSIASVIPNCGCDRYASCFRVCGKNYDTTASYAPTCSRGGPVLSYTDSLYNCGMGDCGGYSGKEVRIRLVSPEGQTVIDDTVTTDADGSFSYTFTVPAGNGQFTVIASVPRG